jgi:hypothetical protein
MLLYRTMGNQNSIPSFYAHAPLSGREIRLLSICPSSNPERQLECSLGPCDLDSAPPYEALSYVWGTLGVFTNVSIIVNGEVVSIGSNLASALTRLRRADAPRIVWADGLCINQASNEEKSHQVPLMGSIYSLAQRTVVWLGKGHVRQVRNAVGCVRVIADACREYTRNHTLGTLPSDRYKPVNVPIDVITDEVCASLRDLYDLPWFNRIWCIQEIYLAQDGLMLWGSEEVPWSDVQLAALWIHNKTACPDPSDAVASRLDTFSISRAEWLNAAGNTNPPLLEVLQDFRERDCTDPKDKVYGLLGLVAPDEAKFIHVDYNKSVGEVYADTVLAGIRKNKRLTALAFVSHIDRYVDVGIPSWAPRWNDLRVAMRIGAPDEDDVPFSACAGQLIRPADMQNLSPKRLTLTGIVYDKICGVQQLILPLTFDFNLNHLGDIQIIDRSLNRSRSLNAVELNYLRDHPFVRSLNLARAFDQSPERWQRLARTLNAGETTAGIYAQELDEVSQAAFYGSFLHLMAKMSNTSDPEWGDYSQYESASLDFRTGSFINSTLRRMFLTYNSMYGLGPQCALPGDVVVVLYGGNTPYVLRPRGNEYLFIGQAYVDEIMNGELVRDVESGKRHEEQFCII